MPLFFLNQRLGSDYIPDLEGAHFDSLEQAREEAILAARESMASMVLAGSLDLSACFEIVSPEGLQLTVPFSEALKINGE